MTSFSDVLWGPLKKAGILDVLILPKSMHYLKIDVAWNVFITKSFGAIKRFKAWYAKWTTFEFPSNLMMLLDDLHIEGKVKDAAEDQ